MSLAGAPMRDELRGRLICVEAAIGLVVAVTASSLFSLRSIVNFAARPCRPRPFAPDRSDWIDWGVESVASRAGIRFSSLTKSLAKHLLLRRRGQASRLTFGLLDDGGEWLVCVWVTLPDRRPLGYPAVPTVTPFEAAATEPA